VLNTYLHNGVRMGCFGTNAQRLELREDGVLRHSVDGPSLPLDVFSAKLFTEFMLSQEGQKIIASFGRIPTRRGVSTDVQGLDKLNYVIDDIRAGDDFNKNFELFRTIFGAPRQ